ncbi:MAG: phosphatase PAP2 family protein [Candidatus Shapirobacteria bacterium]|jgi:membrane-associated phospholipid phosphatase|nr:phosphatase PAP2 family protein [Candidatus Shapirobacteria bacterium]
MSTGHPAFLFWQPKVDYLRLLSSFKFGRNILIFLNYAIWLFFFYLSYLLIKHDFSFFWLLLLTTLLAEIVERLIKKKNFWCRPMFLRHDCTPSGLVDKWYRSGAFPSGHTIKATIFLLFLIFTPLFPLWLFFIIVLPLLWFRVLVGFHYPVDILGGIAIGFFIWLIISFLNITTPLDPYLQSIFNTIFLIN